MLLVDAPLVYKLVYTAAALVTMRVADDKSGCARTSLHADVGHGL